MCDYYISCYLVLDNFIINLERKIVMTKFNWFMLVATWVVLAIIVMTGPGSCEPNYQFDNGQEAHVFPLEVE